MRNHADSLIVIESRGESDCILYVSLPLPTNAARIRLTSAAAQVVAAGLQRATGFKGLPKDTGRLGNAAVGILEPESGQAPSHRRRSR